MNHHPEFFERLLFALKSSFVVHRRLSLASAARFSGGYVKV